MAFLLALTATVVAVPLVIRASSQLGLVDIPGDDPLKVHQRPTPNGGGLALVVGLAAASFVIRPTIPFVVGGVGALALGLLDDRRGLSPRVRLVAAVVIGGSVSILITGQESWLRLLVAASAIVIAINAANLFDGLDGLLTGGGMVTAAGLALLSAGSSRAWLWALAGCLAGFLVFNRPPARIFLGDGGAYLVGVTLGVGFAQLSSSPSRFVGGVLVFGVIGLDFVVTILRRARSRTPLFAGDRSHLYDQLTDRGWSPWRVLRTIWIVHLGLALVGLGVARLSSFTAVIVGAVVVTLMLLGAGLLGFLGPEHHPRYLGRQ